MKHTPGPWKWENIPSAGFDIKAKIAFFKNKKPLSFFQLPTQNTIRFQLNERGELWGSISYETWVQFKSVKWKEMQKANARLIAKCPTMYKYIKKKADMGCKEAKAILSE